MASLNALKPLLAFAPETGYTSVMCEVISLCTLWLGLQLSLSFFKIRQY